MSTYAEKLRSPLWQRKRLEVMDKSDWKCALCADSTTTLNVHHPKYEHGKEPWEYDNLICLCQECHEKIHTHAVKQPSDIVHLVNRLSGVFDSLDLLPPDLRQKKKKEIWDAVVSLAESSGVELGDDLKNRFAP